MLEARLHHVGFVVASVEEALPSFAASLGAQAVSEVFHDPLQRAKVALLEPPSPDGVKIELVAPAGPSSPVAAFLERGGGFHHLCYEVDDLELQLRRMRERRAVVIRPPKPAVAFGGRRIAWVVTRERMLLEYLERGPAAASGAEEGPAT